jgi:xanthine dehydrogenase YagS FAD-binding subunit
MQAFEWANAKTFPDAVRLLATPGNDIKGVPAPDQAPHPIGGGQDLHTTLKSYIVTPPRVVNLKTIPESGRITVDASGLTLGATATLTQIANHADVKKFSPGLVESLESVATPQIRNFGTIGGNLCQRPRCWYFRLEDIKCLKRGGDTCYAKDGENKYLALYGTDAPCVITQPSDPAQILVALNAIVSVAGSGGTRDIPAGEFFRTQIRIPAHPLAARSTYLKFKERSSLDFAMASVAAAVELGEGGTVKTAKLVLGGVAPVPWKLPAVEAMLAGKKLDEATIAKAAEMAVADARPLSQTGYKVPLVRTLVMRALTKLA